MVLILLCLIPNCLPTEKNEEKGCALLSVDAVKWRIGKSFAIFLKVEI